MKYIFSLLVIVFFTNCETNTLTNKEVEKHTIKGKEISQAVLKKLGGNLMSQMKSGGVKQAIPFCNVAALPLTEELSNKYNVSIKRTTHKLRNAKNKPNLEEEKILRHYIASISKGEKIKPIVTKGDDYKIHFYAPIKLDKKCLACHGSISKKTDSIIKSYYPNDAATGFKEGDLRGLMSITFN
jgi:hypothetical protein